MIKKIMYLIILMMLGCASFKTVQYQPLNVNSEKELYPAIIGACEQSGIKIKTMDILNEYYETEEFEYEGLYRASMIIKKEGNIMNAEVNNVKTYNYSAQDWEEGIFSIGFDKNTFRMKFFNRVSSILDDSNAYGIKKNTLLSNFDFLYIVLNGMTEVARERWITQNIQDHRYEWRYELLDFNFNHDTDFKRYKYVAHFIYNVDKSVFSIGDKIFLRLYTNSDEIAQKKLHSIIAIRGMLKTIEKGTLNNYYFYLVDEI